MSAPIEKIAQCVYVGNTAAIDEQTLFNYCSQYGPIQSCNIGPCPWPRRYFCDFRIVQYINPECVQNFVDKPCHRLGKVVLDVKYYKDLWKNADLLNISRKLFVGPVRNNHQINTIVEFYRAIDPNLQHCISKQYQKVYLLFEFSNRQYVRTVLERNLVPKDDSNQSFAIHPAVNPIEFIRKSISTNNPHCQVLIHGLTERITEKILTEYFEKRASVITCLISPKDPTIGLIELENENYARKLLDLSSFRLNGSQLSLSKVSACSTPLSSLFPNEQHPHDDDDEIDHLLEVTAASSFCAQRTPPLAIPSPLPPVTTAQSQTETTASFPPSLPSVSSPPEITECGWASPPHTIVRQSVCTDGSEAYTPSQPSSTTNPVNSISTDPSLLRNADVKPTPNSQKNILQFVEEFLTELDQVKEEYKTKFTEDRRVMEREFDQLIRNERAALKEFRGYIQENRRHSKHSRDTNKRKHHHLSSNH